MVRPDGLLEIGQIRRAHGVRGDVLVELASDRPERVAAGARWFARDRWLTVVAARPHQDRWLVSLAEVDDRTHAQHYTNVPVYAEPLDDPDALFVHELIGADVVDTAGASLGRVESVEANPASDLLVLDGGGLIPLRFVVGREPGRLVVDPPPGLLD